jgi:hypothetical protein
MNKEELILERKCKRCGLLSTYTNSKYRVCRMCSYKEKLVQVKEEVKKVGE